MLDLTPVTSLKLFDYLFYFLWFGLIENLVCIDQEVRQIGFDSSSFKFMQN